MANIDDIKNMPEYIEFQGMLSGCKKQLKGQAKNYAKELADITLLLAEGKIRQEIYIATVKNQKEIAMQWVNTQAIGKRQKLEDLVVKVAEYAVTAVVNAIINKIG